MTRKKQKIYKESDVMVLLESMDDGIKIISESQQQSQKDIAGFKENMSDVKEELSEIKYMLKRKVDYDEFKKLEKRVLRLERSRA